MLIGLKTKEAMSVSSYDSALAEIFAPKRPRQNLLRKAYINHWYGPKCSMAATCQRQD